MSFNILPDLFSPSRSSRADVECRFFDFFFIYCVDSYEESHVNMLNYNIDITISFGQFGS